MVAEIHSAEVEIGGKTLSFETGRMARLANCSVIARYGDTECLVTSVMSEKKREGIDFLPLMVNFEERMYSAGKIPGGFIKREGRPSEPSILAGRVIDRPIRPLFDSSIRRDINITVMVLSTDNENIPDMIGLNGATCSLLLSDIPFNHTVAGVRVAKVDGEFVFFPTYEQKDASDIDLLLVGTREKIVMVEANCLEVPESEILEAIDAGHEVIGKICDCMDEFRTRAGLDKKEMEASPEAPDDLKEAIEKIVESVTEDIYSADGKKARDRVFSGIREKVDEYLEEYLPKIENADEAKQLSSLAHDWEYKTIKKTIRENILKNDRRPDNRKATDIREITCEVGLSPRCHGSGLFTRGETQVLSTVTLGAPGNAQTIDDIHPYIEKRYLHHYQSLPFSFGDTGFVRGPGRREIGHGALAERAVLPLIPDQDIFPYVIRVNSDVMMSNGSTSMGSTCASVLALMDAGVPIKKPVSGIAMGMITGENGEYKILTDLMGTEDFMGDMDFKVTGTKDGVTAIQMDTKTEGLTREMIVDILAQANEGRAFILQKMLDVIPEPRDDLSPYAPRIIILQINHEKIGDIIGPGGKIVRKIIEDTGVEIDIEDDGRVYITSNDAEGARIAKETIEKLVEEVEPGKVYKGTIVRLEGYGAFVQILPGKDGLLHISRISHSRINDINNVLKMGQEINVRVTEIDEMGRINISTVGVKQEDGTELSEPAGASSGGSTGGSGGGYNRNQGGRYDRDSRSGSRPPRRDSKYGGSSGSSSRYPKRDKYDRNDRDRGRRDDRRDDRRDRNR